MSETYKGLSETGQAFARDCAVEFAKVGIEEASAGTPGGDIAEFAFTVAVRLAELCEVDS